MYQATRAVDGENLSEITIHNFEKNRKIESPVGPNREKKRNFCRGDTMTSSSAAELIDRMRKTFSYRTLAYFSILQYCIKTNFFKCHTGMGQSSLYRMA